MVRVDPTPPPNAFLEEARCLLEFKLQLVC